MEGFDWDRVGSVSGDRWTATIEALPVGGPYHVELRALSKDRQTLASTSIQNVLVGDLWVLSGQSNMVGNGRLEDLEPPHELVHNFNPRDEWQVAEEPLHSLAESINEVNWKHASHLLSLWAKPGPATRRSTGRGGCRPISQEPAAWRRLGAHLLQGHGAPNGHSDRTCALRPRRHFDRSRVCGLAGMGPSAQGAGQEVPLRFHDGAFPRSRGQSQGRSLVSGGGRHAGGKGVRVRRAFQRTGRSYPCRFRSAGPALLLRADRSVCHREPDALEQDPGSAALGGRRRYRTWAWSPAWTWASTT